MKMAMVDDASDCGHGVILLTTDIWERTRRGAPDVLRRAER